MLTCQRYFVTCGPTDCMVGALSSTDIPIQFLGQSGETAFVGYQTHQLDSTRLFFELEFVATTVLKDDSVSRVEGAIFHTETPVIATWQVEADWIEDYRDESLSTKGLMAKVLQGLETTSFR